MDDPNFESAMLIIEERDAIIERLTAEFKAEEQTVYSCMATLKERDAEITRLRAAVATGLSWLNDLQHMGSIVDQQALSKDIAQLTAALGLVRADEQSTALSQNVTPK